MRTSEEPVLAEDRSLGTEPAFAEAISFSPPEPEPESGSGPGPELGPVPELEPGPGFESRSESESGAEIIEAFPSETVSGPLEPERRAGGVRRARKRLKHAERERRDRELREQRRFTAHRRRRRRVWVIAAAAVLGLALFVAAGVFTPIMAVRDIQVQGAQAVNVEELELALSKFEGVPLALVQDGEVHRALEPFPMIERYAVERIPPSTLVVRIEERAPAIALQRDDGYDLLDPAGVVLFRVAEPPVGVPVANAEMNDTASPAFRAAAGVVRDMPEDLRAALATVRATNAQDVSFTLTNGTEVIWGEAKDTQLKAIVLRSLIAATGLPAMIDVSAPEAPVFR